MDAVEQAKLNHLRNIEGRAGRPLEELRAMAQASGLTRHRELLEYFKRELGLGHGDANALAGWALRPAEEADAGAAAADPAEALYVGAKAALRPIHDAAIAAISALGEFEIAPKKGYLSLRRRKQFAMLGPATNTRVELGLNLKGAEGAGRLEAQPAGGMCSHRVKLTAPEQVDAELTGWLRQAFDAAG